MTQIHRQKKRSQAGTLSINGIYSLMHTPGLFSFKVNFLCCFFAYFLKRDSEMAQPREIFWRYDIFRTKISLTSPARTLSKAWRAFKWLQFSDFITFQKKHGLPLFGSLYFVNTRLLLVQSFTLLCSRDVGWGCDKHGGDLLWWRPAAGHFARILMWTYVNIAPPTHVVVAIAPPRFDFQNSLTLLQIWGHYKKHCRRIPQCFPQVLFWTITRGTDTSC